MKYCQKCNKEVEDLTLVEFKGFWCKECIQENKPKKIRKPKVIQKSL